MARKKALPVEELLQENISVEPLENVMGDRYATYAKYVIQDRAIPDVRDGLKPVQRRIIFSMFKHGNTYNKPTRKCAHTVGAVMGTFHPHGDTSIYEALARMSQDWKVRYPLIDFQGNNGSIDGDSPAAYRYTESRLNQLANEMIRDIDKKTVDMQLNFDDTEFEPSVLPSRFPNLLCNGTEGIAVALATEIPPHNLREVIDATIYRIQHKNCNIEDLMQIVKGPDFPGGGNIYKSDGLKNIYLTGRGKIEISSKIDIVENKDGKQIVITEIPYKEAKTALVYEIDKIIHAKSVSGMLEIRDESDWNGIRIVIDCKKDAKVELLVNYLMNKTRLVSSYSANMVAIVNGSPKTLTLLDFIDAYIAHQIDVVTRKTVFDLDKFSARLHIVEGLILATLNINEVVDIIRKSKDKADSKVNLIARYNFSNEQAEAIVTMPLYKLSHTDETILENERDQLIKDIENFKNILNDSNKLNRVIIKDLKEISEKYGDERRTQIIEKTAVKPIDKRELIAKEEVYVAVTRDGYIKRSTVKSFRSSGENSMPGLKDGDIVVTYGSCLTTDYLVSFTNLGNYICIPVHKIKENKWKDEGDHLNTYITLGLGEKIVKAMAFSNLRNDLNLAFLSKYGQVKRMFISSLDFAKHSKPTRCMKILNTDEVIAVELLTGNSDLLVITSNGHASMFNENEITIVGNKAGGVKSIASLGKNNSTVALLTFAPEEKSKFVFFTNKGHYRILDNTKINSTNRLAKSTVIMPCFKNDVHTITSGMKIPHKLNEFSLWLNLSDTSTEQFTITEFYLDDIVKNAKSNIDLAKNVFINNVYDTALQIINNSIVSYSLPNKEVSEENVEFKSGEDESISVETPKITPIEEDEPTNFEQISIFDDLE